MNIFNDRDMPTPKQFRELCQLGLMDYSVLNRIREERRWRRTVWGLALLVLALCTYKTFIA